MADDIELKHHFLLAMPGQAGSYFGDTITYLCEHNADGALGLMVNRPSRFTLLELLAQLGIDGDRSLVDVPVLEGGPVSTEHGFVLHSHDDTLTASADLGNGLMLSTAREVLEAIAANRGPARYLVTLGYAGWGPGQLERELADNAWLTCPAEVDILFDVPFEERINRAAATLGIDFNLMTGRPGYA